MRVPPLAFHTLSFHDEIPQHDETTITGANTPGCERAATPHQRFSGCGQAGWCLAHVAGRLRDSKTSTLLPICLLAFADMA